MKSEKACEAWKEKHRQIEVRDEFADTVMNQIYQCERKRRESLIDMRWLAELISQHSLVKAGMVAAGAALGLARAALVICAFLRA
ncbi:MAG: hypothetical protein H8E73_08430 [Planctomycetes bacterium]|nr:hypothetical protein [Planctomycetota bacterium]